MDAKGKVFIVTGGASGLGEACVRALRAQGSEVVIADRDEVRANAVAADTGAVAVVANIIEGESAQRAVDTAMQRFGALNGLVNCAGIGTAKRIVGRDGPQDLDAFRRVVDINLIGTFNMMRLAAAAMQKGTPDAGGERGVIINTASVAAFDGQIGQAAYASSKAAVVGLTLPAARELAAYGIRVMTIAPGIFATPLVKELPAEALESLGRMVPFPPRLGEPAEFAGLVCHIVGNPMLNGEVIRLDGAIRMAAK
jgi:NAD(P)-dependent dehydrogenase (short-subunit alcohol dehydrogenase family)